jgi:hypothetical protein
MLVQHKTLSDGGWEKLTLAEQLGNIGSEVSRALQWRGKDNTISQNSFDRALELLDFTIRDSRWRGRLKELVRVREFLCDAFYGGKEYGGTLESFDHYFLQFALAARLKK